MKTRLLHTLAVASVLVLATLTALTLPAQAQTTVYVQLPTGEVIPFTIPAGKTIDDVVLPGPIVPAPTNTTPDPSPTVPTSPTTPFAPTTPQTTPSTPTTPPLETVPTTPTVPRTTPTTPKPPPAKTTPQLRDPDEDRVKRQPEQERLRGHTNAKPEPKARKKKRRHKRRAAPEQPLRNPDGSPTPSNPGFVDALPGPSVIGGVPNFVIRKFRVPPFLLPIYQAAGIEYGIRWEILAAINEIETDYGRNLNVSSAGALGWMQFMPATWRAYGTDANQDGRKDPYNPVDAIFAAARYLNAAGYAEDVRGAIFAYNHADWYVDSVLLRARLIAGVPADVIGSLTGLTEGRFPVYARARYADDIAEREALKKVRAGENAANVVESVEGRRGIEIYAREGSPVVAVNDGIVKEIGRSERLGRYLVLQDVYGNRYTYGHLGSVSRYYPVPKDDVGDLSRQARALAANDPEPTAPASAGRQPADDEEREPARRESADSGHGQPSVPVKERLFANPEHPLARGSGGLEQVLERKSLGDYTTYRNYFARPFGLDSSKVRLRALREGSRVIGGTILGRVGRTGSKAAHLEFEIRPAGKGAPRIDPKPILDGWKLLEATAIYRASGRNVLHGEDAGSMSIGQILLLSKPQLERRVLADERIEVYEGGRDDIRSGQIDRRVLATLAYLAESGLKPTVSSLRSGHSYFTSSGNVSHHSSGNAVDIAAINGIPITGHQEPGGITDQTVRRLMLLQGTIRPAQIISLLDHGQNTLAMSDHHDHIHVGFQPMFGANAKLGRQALTVLEPDQWSDLLDRLGEIDNPVVPTEPSKYALPADDSHTASHAHHGE